MKHIKHDTMTCPDGREVKAVTLTVKYVDDDSDPFDALFIIDQQLAYTIHELADGDNAWSKFDDGVFFYCETVEELDMIAAGGTGEDFKIVK